MSLPDNYVTVNHSFSSPASEVNKHSSLPNSSRINDSKLERNMEDFLNKIVLNNDKINDIDNNSNSDSVTLKDNSKSSSLLLGNDSEIPINLVEDNNNLSNTDDNCQINEIINQSIPDRNSRNSNINLNSERSFKSPKNPDIISFGKTDFELDNSGKVATPTIKLTKKSNYHPSEFEEKTINKEDQKLPDYQEFSNKLTEMSLLLEKKDEEIKKLCEKLLEVETKNKSRKKSSSSSSSSSSSDESKESSKKKSKPKKEKKEKHKPKNKKEKKEKKKDTGEKNEKKSKSKENKEKIEIPPTNIVETSNSNIIIQENLENLDSKIKENISVSNFDENSKFIMSINNDNISVDKEKLAPDLRKKLDELEEEVRRLQQANIDSILTLQKLHDNNATSNHTSNDVVINQLLVDHNLLKEELQQLKWEHSKLTQPGLLVEEINQLKRDMNFLRKQNDFLKHFTKKSSRSLNHLSSPSYHIRDCKENFELPTKDRKFFASNIANSNNSSNYIYQKLQNHRKPIEETPSIHKMLKHSIESLESPYHATCHNIQYSTPFSGGPTYRARKISDSSSVLIEDPKPKAWVEAIPKNYNQPCKSFPVDSPFPPNNFHKRDFDEQSVDSYITVTTSVTEKSDDEWRPNIRKYESNGDFLSTQDSEISDVSTMKDTENYQGVVRCDYPFTPERPSDLNLEDIVKFVRPGGKMSTGRVCFIGHLPGRSEVCVGLELGEDAGKHDGLFEGHRYFQCRKNRGVFISFHKIILAYKSI